MGMPEGCTWHDGVCSICHPGRAVECSSCLDFPNPVPAPLATGQLVDQWRQKVLDQVDAIDRRVFGNQAQGSRTGSTGNTGSTGGSQP